MTCSANQNMSVRYLILLFTRNVDKISTDLYERCFSEENLARFYGVSNMHGMFSRSICLKTGRCHGFYLIF